MATWNEIKKSVNDHGNVLTLTMGDLRDATGSGKLGSGVVTEIRNTLAQLGLGHVPQDLTTEQSQPVRLYQKGKPVGELIDLVLMVGEPNDTQLRDQFSQQPTDQAARTLAKIRQLLTE
jgi:hypothetical protein